jgi:hypothetical protein
VKKAGSQALVALLVVVTLLGGAVSPVYGLASVALQDLAMSASCLSYANSTLRR